MKLIQSLAAIIGSAFVVPMTLLAGPVNVNSATADTIAAELKGVGLSKAVAIVDYREAHGPFATPEDLLMVKGIGARTIELNRSNIKLDGKRPNNKTE